jgi:hypothetical protein
MTAHSRANDGTLPTDCTPIPHRSRATVGKAISVDGSDLRKAWARRHYDLMAAHVADLGGRDAVSEAELSILRRASTLELERLESRLADSPEPDPRLIDTYSRVAGNLRRLLESLGLQRRAKPAVTLQEYLANRQAEAEPDEGEDAEGQQ